MARVRESPICLKGNHTETVSGALISGAKDVNTGMLTEMGGQIAGKVIGGP